MYTLGRIAVLLVLLTLCMPAAAQTPAPAKEAGSISGRIMTGGKAVARARVLLSRSVQGNGPFGSDFKVTGEDGRYTFTNLAPGQYAPVASAPGYAGTIGEPVTVDEGEAVENVDISLARGSVITGRVTDSRGRPIIGERILLQPVDGRPRAISSHRSANVESMITDDRGIYRAFGLSAGHYIVAVGEEENPQYIAHTYSFRAAYRRTYYPDVAEQSQAKVVEVAEGGEAAGVDITVGGLLKKYTVTGKVIDEATGKPVPNIRVTGQPAVELSRLLGGHLDATSDANGIFRFEALPPGPYRTYSVGREDIGYADPIRFEVTDKEVSGLELKIKRGITVNGLAVISGTEDPQVKARLEKLRMSASVEGGQQAEPKSLGSIKINPDGSFRLAGVTPGRLVFHFPQWEGNKNFLILQVERNGVPQPNGVAIAPGDKNVNLKLVLGYGTGTVRGQLKVENGELPYGARVAATLFTAGSPIQHIWADGRGRFAFEGLPAGEYEVVVQVSVTSADGAPPFGKPVKEKVYVASGSESQVTLVLDASQSKQEDR